MSRQGRDTDTQKGRVTSEQEKSGASSKGSAPSVSMMSSSKQESKPITLKRKLFNPGGTPDDEGERKAVTKRRRSQAASGDESPSTASASHASSHTQQGLTPTTPKSSTSAPGAGPSPSAGNTTPNVARHGMPLSERQQMALVMQMTASEQSSGGDASPYTATSPPPSSSLAGGSSSVGKKTPLDRKVNKRNERGETMLHMAAKRGDVKHTRKLIKAGADVNVRDYAGWTPLHEACNHGSSAVARLLLRAGAIVNVQGLDNDTPLHDAAGNGHEKIVEVLMGHGANPNQPNSKGKSPLDIAANETILRILRQEVTLVGSSSGGSCMSSDEEQPFTAASPDMLSDKELESPISVVKRDQHELGSYHHSSGSHLTTTHSQPIYSKAAAGNIHDAHNTDSLDDPYALPLSPPSHTPYQHPTPHSTSSIFKKVHVSRHMDKSASPRLTLKFQHIKPKEHRGGSLSTPITSAPAASPARARTSQVVTSDTAKYKTYSVSLGSTPPTTGDDFDKPMYSPAGSTSSQESDLYDPKLEITTFGSKRGLCRPTQSSEASCVSEAVSGGGSRQSGEGVESSVSQADSQMPMLSQESGPFSPNFDDSLDDKLQRHRGVKREAARSDSPKPSSFVSVSRTSPPGGKQRVGDVSSTSDSKVVASKHLPMPSSVDVMESHHSKCGRPKDISPPVSSAATHTPSPSIPKDSKLTINTDIVTMSARDKISPRGSVDKTLSPGSSRVSPRLSDAVVSPLPGRSSPAPAKSEKDRTHHKLDRDAARSPKPSEEKTSPKLDQHRGSPKIKLDANRASPKPISESRESRESRDSRDSRDSPKSDNGRPASPKVPPLKIIMHAKTTASAEHDTRSQKAVQSKTVLPYVVEVTSAGGGEAIVAACETGPLVEPAGLSGGEQEVVSSSLPPNAEVLRKTRARVAAFASATMETGESVKESLVELEDGDTKDSVMSGSSGSKRADESPDDKKTEEGQSQQSERRLTRSVARSQQREQEQKTKDGPSVCKDDSSKDDKDSNHASTTSRRGNGSSNHSNQEKPEDEIQMHPRKRKLRHRPQVGQQPAETNSEREVNPPLAPMHHIEKPDNPYEMYLDIRKKVAHRRQQWLVVQPKAPQGFTDYLMVNCNYLLKGNLTSHRSVPTLTAPPSLPAGMRELFEEQERGRYKLRLQHVIEREKLMLSIEQEIVRVHGRAARALANQATPLSVCTILRDEDIYNTIDTDEACAAEEKDHRGSSSATARSRYNGRQFLSWLQDVDDKFEKIKESLLMRHHHEAESLHAVQKLEWEWRLKELKLLDHRSTPQISALHVPMVQVNDDFDLLPA